MRSQVVLYDEWHVTCFVYSSRKSGRESERERECGREGRQCLRSEQVHCRTHTEQCTSHGVAKPRGQVCNVHLACHYHLLLNTSSTHGQEVRRSDRNGLCSSPVVAG